jgi:molybdate/tungstate transport system substrate-binding protein
MVSMGTQFQAVTSSILFMLLLLSGCELPAASAFNDSPRTPLVVFAAGSLILPFQDLETAFEELYPDVDIQAQFHGSIQVMRHATELHEPIDVVATADASLVPLLMYTATNPDTGQPYADWYIRFASNRLSIASQPGSLYASEIDPDNWYSILSRPDIKVGIPDPRFDAAGYRTLMAFALARDYYQEPTIFTDMFAGDFNYPLGIFSEGDLTTITVPEIVETTPGSPIVVRGSSIALLALLESGDLDYAFEYESVILQHGLQIVNLPAAVNLGTVGYDSIYNSVQVVLDIQRFASVEPVFQGERIGYGITIPDSAPHPQEAAQFIAFLLGPEGRRIMQADHHPLFEPAIGENYSNIPLVLQALCVPEDAP